ncbi:hypothetical protein I8J32_014915 [Lysobacter solisilvae]|uniref:Uncharacterized protein n=2 Tax=Agrilutibacter solisilvae TaxID=2763317 RepID=A0A975AUA3_9GAMM|nr:DUF6587 family protein [Lysobacter solisilvae]QSX80095.1 hypothetical protein I8J32_014915 [Lysobacter solisilvae]
MHASLLAQYVVIALAVALSAGFVVRRQFPQEVRRLRLACAVPLVREGRPSWLRRIGQWLAPVPQGDGGSCGGCNGCGPG